MVVLLLSVIPCSTSAYFTCTLFTWLTFLHTCPRSQVWLVVALGQNSPFCLSKVWLGAYLSVAFPGNWKANLTSISPITGNLPLLPEVKTAAMSCLLHTVWCCSRTLLQTDKFPHSLNCWSLCCWLWALSLVLKLVKYRPFRLVG